MTLKLKVSRHKPTKVGARKDTSNTPDVVYAAHAPPMALHRFVPKFRTSALSIFDISGEPVDPSVKVVRARTPEQRLASAWIRVGRAIAVSADEVGKEIEDAVPAGRESHNQ